jgi:arylsulfatase A-like enzyme
LILGYSGAVANRRDFLKASLSCGAGAAAFALAGGPFGCAGRRKPHIVLILADDLGYSQLGCYGETRIRTPHIDRLAAEGTRFTQAYSGSPVCAPSRCVLLTGLHTGHARVRDNREIQPEGQEPLPAGTPTLARLLKAEGYATGLVGKWGLGYPGSPGEPLAQGFDFFFGYNCQRKAHNHYPPELWRNRERIRLEGNDGGLTGRQYAPDLFEKEALDFITSNRRRPFFLFFATTVPHLALQVPEDSLAEYAGLWPETPYDGGKGYQPHPAPRAAYAAMVTRLDRSVGRIMARLAELGLDKDTFVLFASDNGATYDVGGYDMEFFRGTGPFRSHKGYVYEGGIRVPLIVRRPGAIPAGRASDAVVAFQDLLPTLLGAAGAGSRVPAGVDGASRLGLFEGRTVSPAEPRLYMEFPDYGGQQMARAGKWKAVRQNLLKDPGAPVELYDLDADPGETTDVAAANPGVVAALRNIMAREHRSSAEFPFPALDRPSLGE